MTSEEMVSRYHTIMSTDTLLRMLGGGVVGGLPDSGSPMERIIVEELDLRVALISRQRSGAPEVWR